MKTNTRDTEGEKIKVGDGGGSPLEQQHIPKIVRKKKEEKKRKVADKDCEIRSEIGEEK